MTVFLFGSVTSIMKILCAIEELNVSFHDCYFQMYLHVPNSYYLSFFFLLGFEVIPSGALESYFQVRAKWLVLEVL